MLKNYAIDPKMKLTIGAWAFSPCYLLIYSKSNQINKYIKLKNEDKICKIEKIMNKIYNLKK